MTQATQARGIQMTDTALQQILGLREKQGRDLCLRMGVKGGGCSGLSYTMTFEEPGNTTERDEIYDYDGFQVVCDKKSLLYLYGMTLDYSDAMLGGGFKFINPNAAHACSCGQSFSA
ncbi:iron-sulfur cluster assembly accessory protein [Leptolyngbya sp. FACHB-261]|uniref:HesB/IscA family protein n=1 Tax=Leptolyngbya sp. FACHB-261 TaxID=2692806 RepID=UPI001682648E|nr:iron-sulfur cluster assembly accessory protein [Leptolyngbya sp. FACHB-261]MBD2104084.1 iron-sulfur cluster assembly accessory protein [Leptolyngbya sp. FACHB-261]